MKIFLYIICIVVFIGCDSENAPDCFQSSGDIIQQDFDIDAFDKIIVWNRVQLIISQGRDQSVVVETGENLLNEIHVRVEDSILKVSNRNSCNYTRDYGITKVYVKVPNLSEIRNSSGLTVESRGIIGFPDIVLISDDREVQDEFHIDGDFRMTLDVIRLKVVANGLSKFYLNGKAQNAFFGAYDSDVRIEAGNLIVQNISFFHRSTNKMIIHPTEQLRGEIRGLGDVIAKNRPPIVEVEEFFTGRLIFE